MRKLLHRVWRFAFRTCRFCGYCGGGWPDSGECPSCGETLVIDDTVLEAGTGDCPACGQKFAISFDGDCGCGEDGCSCGGDCGCDEDGCGCDCGEE